jgi:ribonucleoside-diphosphate reductase alpha chain
MSGATYRRSAELAAVVGTYAGYPKNKAGHDRVMAKHEAANAELKPVSDIDAGVLEAATEQWRLNTEIGARNGWRNSQISLLAPTGTIGFMMDCDTTGIEPDFSLVKYKKLSTGGSMQIVNQTIPFALHRLGYSQETVAVSYTHLRAHET